MTDDERLTWGFILEVLDVMERHGYHRSDNQHTGQAIGLLGNLAHVYDGTKDAPRGADVTVPTSPQHSSRSPQAGPARTRSSSPAPTPAPSSPHSTSPPATSATAPQPAPTAPTRPA